VSDFLNPDCFCHTTPENDMPEWGLLIAKIDQIQQTLDAILEKFEVISTEVQPMIDSISVHPLFKMFGGKR
jgi:hypothetical protein